MYITTYHKGNGKTVRKHPEEPEDRERKCVTTTVTLKMRKSVGPWGEWLRYMAGM